MKLSERTVYVVRGSEDGVLGVYTSKPKAWKRACEYLITDGINHEDSTSKNKFFKSGWATICGKYDHDAGMHCECDIEPFRLNS